MFASFTPYLLAAALAAGFAGGWMTQGWRHDAQRAETLAEATRMNAKRESVSYGVADKTLKAEAKVRTVTKIQVEEVTKYVSVNDCPLSPGFRLFHDAAAAAGELPDASRIADAAAVPADRVAATLSYNYGTCLENAERLTGLQEWVRSQAAVK
jgi:hypothetical protein